MPGTSPACLSTLQYEGQDIGGCVVLEHGPDEGVCWAQGTGWVGCPPPLASSQHTAIVTQDRVTVHGEPCLLPYVIQARAYPSLSCLHLKC